MRLIDADVLIKRLKRNSIFEKITDSRGMNVIEIVEEQPTIHDSNGWIPCSERLPKEANDYLVTQYNRDAIDEYCNGSRISKIFFDVEWWDDIDHECGWDIIAWQPLPKLYKE